MACWLSWILKSAIWLFLYFTVIRLRHFHLSLCHIVSASCQHPIVALCCAQAFRKAAKLVPASEGGKGPENHSHNKSVLDGWGAVIIYAIVQQTVADRCSSWSLCVVNGATKCGCLMQPSTYLLTYPPTQPAIHPSIHPSEIHHQHHFLHFIHHHHHHHHHQHHLQRMCASQKGNDIPAFFPNIMNQGTSMTFLPVSLSDSYLDTPAMPTWTDLKVVRWKEDRPHCGLGLECMSGGRWRTAKGILQFDLRFAFNEALQVVVQPLEQDTHSWWCVRTELKIVDIYFSNLKA